MQFLGKRIELAEIVNPERQNKDYIDFGATVQVLDEEGNKKTYIIVGSDESEPERGKISWVSPIAKALLKAKAGDCVTFKAPSGEKDLEIISIEYKKIPNS